MPLGEGRCAVRLKELVAGEMVHGVQALPLGHKSNVCPFSSCLQRGGKRLPRMKARLDKQCTVETYATVRLQTKVFQGSMSCAEAHLT